MSDYGHLFIIGMMIYRLRNGGGATSWFALFGGLLYGLLGRQDWAMVAPTIYFPALCLCAWLVWSATHADRNSPILASRTLVWIGGCSYSLYLIHNPIISAVQVVGAPSWLGVSVAAPLALASAWAMRRYIEIPGQRFFSSNWPFKTALQRASAV